MHFVDIHTTQRLSDKVQQADIYDTCQMFQIYLLHINITGNFLCELLKKKEPVNYVSTYLLVNNILFIHN